MKIIQEGQIIKVFLNDIPKIDFKNMDELETYFRNLFLKLKKIFHITFTGLYNIDIYLDQYCGVVIELKKEDLELMSYNDIANLILEESTKKTTAELFKKICDLLDLGEKTYENKIGAFYTSLTKDKRFLLLDDGLWDLKKNHSVKVLKIEEALEDMEELEEIEKEEQDEYEEEEEDKDIIYDENPDDDLGDDLDDYKNLVIVDEEDLDNIEP